jgi:MFS family permease
MAEVPRMSSRQRWTLALVCTAAFMLLLDITVVSMALPSIQRDLHASLPDLQWVSAAYALVLAVPTRPADPRSARDPEAGQARNNGTITPSRHRRRPGGRQRPLEFPAGGDAEPGEYLAQVPFDGAGADE